MTRVTRTLAYGGEPDQVGDLHLPAGPGPHPVTVVIHGGFWRAAYARSLGTPLAADLAAHGIAAWNIEYRRVGAGGGWPATLHDVAAAVDHIAELAGEFALDTARVTAVGHSAGGQLAGWLAGRDVLAAGAPGSGPRVRLIGAVSQAGVLDLRDAARHRLGAGAVEAFLGGSPRRVPERYAIASPVQLMPARVPVVCVHGRADDIVPLRQSERYAAAAGDLGRVHVVDGGHFAVIDVGGPAWQLAVRAVSGWQSGPGAASPRLP
ncbi:MAG: alpha/beta fold hydrolase [Mycobacteriales bacterium]